MKAVRWSVTLAYAGFIFYLSSRVWPEAPHLFPYADKVIHLVIYAPLSFCLVWALRATAMRNREGIPAVALLLAILYGITDEVHQMFVPGRQASVVDFIADALGALLGVALARLSVRWLRNEEI